MVAARVEERAYEGGRVVGYRMARTHLGRPVYWVSSYYVDGLLVDAGAAHARVPFLDRLGGRRVEAVAITHHHEDHVGNAALLGARGAVAYASREARDRVPGRLPFYRRHAWGRPEAGRIEIVPRRLSTRNHTFDVVETPGHTVGDRSYIEAREGWAFVGDLLLGVRQVTTRPREDLCATIRSLGRVLEFEPRIVFAGMRVFHEGSQVLRDRLVFLRQVLHDLDVLRNQGLTAGEARRRALGRERFLHYWSLGDFSKDHFVRQAFACLDEAPPL